MEKINLAVCKKLSDSVEESEIKNTKLKHHITALDGELASERIIKELFPLCSSIERKRSFSERSVQKIKRTWRQVLDSIDPSRQNMDQYAAGKFPDIDETEISKILSRLNSCMQFDVKFNVKEECPNCFLVSSWSSK